MQSAVIAVLDSLAGSLEQSATWAMMSGIEIKSPTVIYDSTQTKVGKVVGLSPILQPLYTQANGQSAVLMVLNGVINTPPGFTWLSAEPYSVWAQDPPSFGALLLCSANPLYASTPVPLLVISANLETLPVPDIAALRVYIGSMVSTFWTSDLMYRTTTNLHLASSGQLLTTREINNAGLVTANLVVTEGAAATVPGTPARLVKYRKLNGAGILNPFRANTWNESGSSSCTIGNSYHGDGVPGDGLTANGAGKYAPNGYGLPGYYAAGYYGGGDGGDGGYGSYC